ncbi:MAG TPA: S-layer homology domain-containing protein, partial [Thermaerobacter sp.]
PGDQPPTEPEQPPSDEPGQPQPPERPGSPQPVPLFPDVSGTLAPEVHRARQLGVVEGFPDGRFRPQEAVSRAEFAKMVVRAVEVARGASLTEPAAVPFRDVDRDMALYEAIAKAAAQGYILGYPDKTFRPDQAITREQAAAVLQRVAGIRGAQESFPDVPDGSRFAPAVAAVAEVELMRGHTNGRFGFGEPLRRAEAAAVAVRLHDFLQQKK